MKNSKFTKILILTLTAALLACFAFAFGASAEGEAQASEIEIAGKNVGYGATLSIQYAVLQSSVSDTATLEVYEGDPANGGEFKFSVKADAALCTDAINGMTGPFYTYTVTGFAAADVCDEVYVFVKDGDAVSETVKYSPAEYFYERLFADDVINPDDETETYQKALYLSYLEHAADAQDYFLNFKNGENVTLVTDRHYVNIVGGSAGVYETGHEITLGETSTLPGWNVTTYTLKDDGTATSTTAYKAAGSTITLAEGATATLIKEGEYVGEYFSQYGGLDYEGVTMVTGLNNKVFVRGGGYAHLDNPNYETTKQRAWLSIVTEDDGNTALNYFSQTASPYNNGYIPTYVGITTETASGNCFVFETDIKIESSNSSLYDENYSNSDGSWMLGFIPAVTGTVSGAKTTDTTYSADNRIAYITVDTDDEGATYHYHLGYNGALYMAPEITANEWHNIRIEYYSTGKVVLYVDGTLTAYKSLETVYQIGDSFGDSIDNLTYDAMAMVLHGSAFNSSVVFDNTVVTVVEKTAP